MEDQEEQPTPVHVPIRGKDLPGAVNVLPAGLSEVLAKRESREINFEQSGSSMSFSTGLKSGARVEQTFSTAAKSSASSSFMSTQSHGQFMSAQSASSSVVQHQSVSKSLSHGLQTSFQTSKDFHHQQHHEQRILNEQKVQSLHHGEEIEQESLKHTLQSAITDIEDQIDGGDFEADKENTLPVEQIQEHQQEQQQALYRQVQEQQQSHYQQVQEQHQAAEKNESHSYNKQNGFASMSVQNSTFSSSRDEFSQHSTTLNGIHHEDSSSTSNHRIEQDLISGDGSSTIMDKFLNAGSKIDSGSLKRRNPRQMFTDSAFYSPKFHPSIAEQVEMAHKLSSSLYDDGNKLSKGQEMYLKRLKKSGAEGFEFEEPPVHDKVPNLKLVMNPEGKVQDWTDLPEDELPELQQIASGGPSAEIAQNVVENLQACKGKGGELFAKRRKKADKWIVDESSIGSNAPSQFADHFVQQQMFQQHQFQMQQQEEYQYQQQRVEEEQELERIERQKNQQEQQMIFHQQQKMKQQQSMEIRQQKQQVQDMPPNFKPYSLKGRCFTPTFDTSIHNVQGINVWANKAPKPFGKSSTLPRSAGPSVNKTTYAESPDTTNHAEVSQQQSYEQKVEQVQVQQQQQQVVQQSSQQHLEVESTEAAQRHQADIEEAKRREYEIWFKNQEKEQEMLEYDCSVKYQEKQQAGLSSESGVATQDSIAHASTTQHTEKHLIQTGYSQATSTSSHQEQKHLIEQQLLLEEQRLYEEKMRRLEIEDKKRQMEMYEEEQRLLQQQQEQMRLLQQQEEQRQRQIQEQQRLLQQQEEQRLFQLQEQQRLIEEQRILQEQEQRRILEEQKRQEYLLQQEQQRLLQEQQKMLQQQQEQQRLLQQQQEQLRLLQQQQEQQRLLQQQEEQRQLQLQEQQRQLQLQEQQRLFQQQEQLRLQEERRMIQEQEQRRVLEEQQRQEYLMQQQQRLMEEQRQFEIEEEQRKLRHNEEQLCFQQEQRWQQESQYQHHHQSEISMQMKSSGFLHQQSEGSFNYLGNQRDEQEVEMRQTSGSLGRRDVRQSGVFVGIAGESNSLIADNEAFDYEKHTVRSLVDHFSKAKLREVPKQVAQHFQNSQAPPLSYLREQAKTKQYQFQEKTKVVEVGQETKEEASRAQELMNRRRNSLKDYLLMEMNDGTNGSGHQIKDPSAILIVDGSVMDGPGPRRLIREVDSQGHSTETGKWDNHNAIARGWKTVEEAYHPVTFRKIYGVGRAGSIHSTASAPQLSPFSQNPDQQFQDEEVDDRSEL